MDFRFWNKPRICTRRMILEALEERIVMDAAVDYIPGDNPFTGRHGHGEMNAAMDPWHVDGGRQFVSAEKVLPAHSAAGSVDMGSLGPAMPQAATTAVSHDALSEVFANKGLDIVLVSTETDKYDAISHAVSNGARALLYDPREETLQSISEKLHDLTEAVGEKIEHLAIVAPGAAGHLKIGADDITPSSVDAHQADFQTLAQSLTSDARIDLYGCNIGEGQQGSSLVTKVARATGVTVWASNDVTGTVPGANWTLEVHSAEDSKPEMIDGISLSGYQIHLAPPIAENTTLEVLKNFHIPPNTIDNVTYQTIEGDGSSPIRVTAADVDNPPAALVDFSDLENVSTTPHGDVAFDAGSATVQIADGMYARNFTYTPGPTLDDKLFTGDQQIQFTVTDTETDHLTADSTQLEVPEVGNADTNILIDPASGDLLVGNYFGEVQRYPRTAPGTYGAPVDATAGGFGGMSHVYQIALAQITTSDPTTPDLVIVTQGNPSDGAFYIPQVGGTYLSAPTSLPGGAFETVVLGMPQIAVKPNQTDPALSDIVVSNRYTPSQLFTNDHAGGLMEPVAVGSTDYEIWGIAVGDVNADGIPDLVESNGSDGLLVFFGQEGSPSIHTTADATISVPGFSWAVAVGNVNGDTNPANGLPLNDIIVGNAEVGQPTRWLEQSATLPGTFPFPENMHDMRYLHTWADPDLHVNGDTVQVQFVDVNGSGHPAIVETNCFSESRYYPGNGHEIVDLDGVEVFNEPIGDSNASLLVTYLNDGEQPDVIAVGLTPVRVSLGEDVLGESTQIMTLSILPFDNPPVNTYDGVTFPGGIPEQIAAPDGTVIFDGHLAQLGHGSVIQMTDADVLADDIVQVTVAATGGDVKLAGNAQGLTFIQGTGDGDEVVVVQGTMADINTALNGLEFRVQPVRFDMPLPTPSVTVISNDLGHNVSDDVADATGKTDTDTVAVVLPQGFIPAQGWWNQPPVNMYGEAPIDRHNPDHPLALSAINGQLVFDGQEGMGHARLLSVMDDAESKAPYHRHHHHHDHDTDIETTLSVNSGILEVAPGAPHDVHVFHNMSDHVKLVGSPSDLSMALRNLTYYSTDPWFVGRDTLIMQTDDLGHNPPDYIGPLTDTDTIAIVVNAPADADGNPFWGRFPRA